MDAHKHEWEWAGRWKMGGEPVYRCGCGATAYDGNPQSDYSRLTVETVPPSPHSEEGDR